MRRVWALIQICIVIGIVGFATFQLFKGNFAAGMSVMPLLLIYYLFLASRNRRD
ncbi:hypothetical protein SAMN06269301_2934 [Geobacter sp. DSM 9736]|nr:hypothetical protein SAMN06269301_2934 [Geobacter sp. DSM 9736]